MPTRHTVTADDVEYAFDNQVDGTLRLVWHHTGTDEVFDVDLSPDDALALARRLTVLARRGAR